MASSARLQDARTSHSSASSSHSSRRQNLPPHLVSQTPPTPSRSPSNASTGGDDVSGADRGEEDDDDDDEDGDSADESDFQADGDPDNPEASSVALSRLRPALATPKQTSTSSPWPFTAAPGTDPSAAFAKSGSDHPHAPVLSSSQGSTVAGPSSTPIGTAQQQSGAGGGDAAMLMSPTQGHAPIPASSLPHEILLHILRLLPPSSLAPALRVCKAWCQCGVELLWYKPTFTSLPSLYKMLQILSHPDQTFPYPDFVRRLSFLPLAKEMSDRLVAKLLPCTRLERLTLTNCKALSSPAIASLLVNSHRLVAIDLTDVEEVDDNVLLALAENCPKLQGLNLSGCSRVTDRGIEALALKAAALRRIKLRKCDQLTDVSVMLLSLHCPLLLEIDLAFCTSITAYTPMQLFRTSSSLREISLPGCTALTDEGFPDATELQLVSAADAVHELANGSGYATPNGTHARNGSNSAASSAPGTPGSGTEPLVSTSGYSLARPRPIRSPPAFQPYDQLRFLDLTSCSTLTDASIAGVAKFCPKLRNLMLGKCSRLTDDALFAICGIGKHLHYLHLGHVNNITDRAVSAIARSCTRLRYVDLANCTNLTDQSVIELASNLPRLKRIGLVRVNNITDDAIDSLAQRTSLERIHLSYCDNLTVAAISSMLQNLQRVTHLSLTGVTSFRKRALQQFCRAPPGNFNDHQRRSFCVFSGRGVIELRKFLKSLTPADLAVLSNPDPPSEDEAGHFARHTNAMLQAAAAAGGGNPAHPNFLAGNGLQQLPAGQTAAQFAATQARLAQIQQARQTLAIAHQRLQAHQAAAAAASARDARQQQHQQQQRSAGGGNGGVPNPYAIQAGMATNNMLGLNLPLGAAAAPWSATAAGPSHPQATTSNGSFGGAGAPGHSYSSSQSSEDDQMPGSITHAVPPHAHQSGPSLLPSGFAPNGSAAYRNSAPPTYAALWSSPTAQASTSLAPPNQNLAGRPPAAAPREESPAPFGMEVDGHEPEGADGPEENGPWRNRRRSTITRQNYLADRGLRIEPDGGRQEHDMPDGSESEGEEEDISMDES